MIRCRGGGLTAALTTEVQCSSGLTQIHTPRRRLEGTLRVERPMGDVGTVFCPVVAGSRADELNGGSEPKVTRSLIDTLLDGG